MKNSLLLSIAILASLFVSAGVKTSVTNGNWSNPNTWSPSGVPFSEDTLIINTHVTADINVDFWANWMIVNIGDSITGDSIFGLHGNLKNDGLINLYILAVGDGNTTINNGIIKGSTYATGNNTYNNQGVIEADSLNTSEIPFDNHGLIDNNMLATSGLFNNYSTILVTGNLIQSDDFVNITGSGINVQGQLIVSGTFTNQSSAVIVTGSLTTSSLLTNNGDISCDNWTNGAGNVNGTNGRFCVALCFINNASISGTVDICDATPSFLCDFNLGTIAGTVTYCAVGACNTSVGLDESIEKNIDISVYPNPFNNVFNIKSEYYASMAEIQVYNSLGQLILTDRLKPSIQSIKLNTPPGVYFIRVISDSNIIASKKLIKH